MVTSNIWNNKYLMVHIKMVNNNKMVKNKMIKILNIWWLKYMVYIRWLRILDVMMYVHNIWWLI